ncbi:MAG: osmoprotectant transport system substrate-binding protein [Solirubrobacteraceae bacterium]|jgi:osmoprotectant transport system substrate-binding protein|nr:osmoprotectant transport system substrate-binding protein [Solirubrobacteraceae bacterium]
MYGRRRGLLVSLLALASTALVAAGCGGSDSGSSGSSSSSSSSSSSQAAAQPGKGKPPITIGTKDFTEEFVLGELYSQALQAKGYNVTLKRNIGPTEIVDKALTSKRIDAYPEYTGITVAVVAKKDLPKTAPATADAAKAFYEGRGQTVIGPTPFQDVDAIATTKEYAQKNNLASVADLKGLPSFKLGARPEFKSRFTGLVGMRKEYGITNAKFRQLALGLQYQALDKGDVDAANVFSTDAQLASGKYTILKDPKGIFGFQNVHFVINKDKYDAMGGTAFSQVIESVNKLLTNDAMSSMNSAVDLDKKDPKAVAAQFLQANGLGAS